MTPVGQSVVDRVELVEGYGIRWRATGAGPTLIWAHDALAGIDDDDDTHVIDFGTLAAGNRLIRFDAVGHGRSAGVFDPADHEWASRGAALVQLARQLELDRFAVGGFGAGAAAALHAAARAPAQVERLVIAGLPTVGAARSCFRRVPGPLGPAALIGLTEPMRFVSRFLPTPLTRRDALGDLLAIRWRQVVQAPRNQYTAVLIGAARSELPDRPTLEAIDVPTLVLAHPRDPFHSVSASRGLVDTLPDAELHVATDGDDVAGWSEVIADFLAR